MIIKKAQSHFYDVFQVEFEGWKGHTRVQAKKTPLGYHIFYVSGLRLPRIKMIEISKTI
jgi:hypothetical protein